MTLETGVKALAEAVAVDVKALGDGKVDKELGKGLSDTSFTQLEKTKLAGIASEATKNRADSENADKVHTHTTSQVTGLGTAATKDVGTGTGQVMEVGAFGVGHTFALAVFDANDIADQVGNKSGFYPYGSNIGSTNVPYAFVYIYQLFAGPDIGLMQIAYGYNTQASWIRTRNQGVWTPWVKQLSTGDLLQTTGDSTELPMSQAAVTDQLATKALLSHTHPVNQVTGLGTAATANLTTSATDGTVGRVLKVGDGGWMGQGVALATALGYPTSFDDATNQTQVIRASVADNGVTAYSSGIHFAAEGTWGRLRVLYNAPRAWIQGGGVQAGTGWTSQVVLSDSLLQTTGTSTDFPMSQAATTNQLTTKADISTQVIAGTGLSGGGTLAANRTLTVSYGTTAGTAAQGNDSRITGALQTSQVVQATGTSTTNVMSQAVTTGQLETKAALRAASNIDGGVRMRLDGTTLYITNDGSDA